MWRVFVGIDFVRQDVIGIYLFALIRGRGIGFNRFCRLRVKRERTPATNTEGFFVLRRSAVAVGAWKSRGERVCRVSYLASQRATALPPPPSCTYDVYIFSFVYYIDGLKNVETSVAARVR